MAIDPETLRTWYLGERRSARDIAGLLGVSKTTVARALRRHGIPVRTASEATRSPEARAKRSRWTPEARAKLAAAHTTHGEAGHGHGHDRETWEHRSWRSMLSRCCNPNATGFKNYGGRGIAVCPEWRGSYAAFLEHILATIGRRPPGKSIDRIDVNGDYEPGNIKRSTPREQARNKRTIPETVGR